MKYYRINEIFHSLQGEGRNTGRAATFIRFAGCNLRCPFCDTDFDSYTEMTADDIVSRLADPNLVVLTGGEPTLQADEELLAELHRAGKYVAMESNGTHLPPSGVDWLTVSPKQHPVVRKCDELKQVFTGAEQVDDYGIEARYYYLQPCDTGDTQRNRQITRDCIEYIMANPRWQLSLQTHKLLGIK